MLNDIGSVTLRTSSVVVADAYADNRDSGAFILIDETTNDTVGAGTIIEPREVKPGVQTQQRHPLAPLVAGPRPPLDGHRPARRDRSGSPDCPRPASRRSRSPSNGHWSSPGEVAYLLDGDNIRHGLSDDLGFSAGDRAENIRRVGHLTRLFADAGVVALASLVSPLKSDREIARALNDAAKLPFIEVYVATSLRRVRAARPQGPVRAGARR